MTSQKKSGFNRHEYTWVILTWARQLHKLSKNLPGKLPVPQLHGAVPDVLKVCAHQPRTFGFVNPSTKWSHGSNQNGAFGRWMLSHFGCDFQWFPGGIFVGENVILLKQRAVPESTLCLIDTCRIAFQDTSKGKGWPCVSLNVQRESQISHLMREKEQRIDSKLPFG